MMPRRQALTIAGIGVIILIIVIAIVSGDSTPSETPSRTATESTRPTTTSTRSETTASKRPFSVSGRGSDYVQAISNAAAGNYVCGISVSGNGTQFGAGYVGIVSYGGDGEYGTLHVNDAARTIDVRSRLVIGDSFSADLPPGEVWFEVDSEASAQWSISCE